MPYRITLVFLFLLIIQTPAISEHGTQPSKSRPRSTQQTCPQTQALLEFLDSKLGTSKLEERDLRAAQAAVDDLCRERPAGEPRDEQEQIQALSEQIPEILHRLGPYRTQLPEYVQSAYGALESFLTRFQGRDVNLLFIPQALIESERKGGNGEGEVNPFRWFRSLIQFQEALFKVEYLVFFLRSVAKQLDRQGIRPGNPRHIQTAVNHVITRYEIFWRFRPPRERGPGIDGILEELDVLASYDRQRDPVRLQDETRSQIHEVSRLILQLPEP